MWKIQKAPTTNLFIQITLASFLSILLWDTAVGLSDKRLCADENCKSIISYGRGMINYPAGDNGMVSFKINSPLRIKSKSAGSDESLWGIEVNGREGYAPKKFIKEEKVLVREKDLQFTVDVIKPGSQEPTVEPHILNSSEVTVETTTTQPLVAIADEAIISKPVENASTEKPEIGTPVQQAAEIIDGTRIPTLDDNIADNMVEDVNEGTKPTAGMEDDEEDNEDDDEIGDYDDDEEDLDRKVDSPTNAKPVLPYNLSASTDNKKTINLQEPAVEPVVNSGEAGNLEKLSQTVNVEVAMAKVDAVKATTVRPITDSVQVDNAKASANIDAVETTTVASITESVQVDVDNAKNSYKVDPVESTTGAQIADVQLPLGQVLNEAIELQTSTEEVQTSTDSVAVSTELPFKVPDLNQAIEDNAADLNITENTQPQEVPVAVSKENYDKEATENATGDVYVTTANDNEKNLNENNISAEQSLPKNISNNDDIPREDTSLPVDSTDKVQASVENVVSDNTHHMSPNTVQNDSPAMALPIEQLPLNSPETENLPHANTEPPIYQYYIPPQTVDAQKTSEDILNQQTAQPELQVTEQPQLGPEKSIPSPQEDPYQQNTNEHATPTPYNPYDYVESSNTPLPPQYEYNNNPTEIPQTTDTPVYHDYYGQQPTGYDPVEQEQVDVTVNQQQQEHINPLDVSTYRESEVTTENPNLISQDNNYGQSPYGQGSVEPLQPMVTTETPKAEEEPKALPSLTPPVSGEEPDKKDNNKGLFATIMDTVNNILPNNKKSKQGSDPDDNELNRILYPDVDGGHRVSKSKDEANTLFCEKLGPHDCPHGISEPEHSDKECVCSLKSLITTEFTLDTFIQALAAKVLEISELLAFLAIVAAATLFFIFGYYCFCNSSSEGALLSKLNQLESSLLASHKENAILKHNLMSTRQKLSSIEDNSFGSNDMVVSIKKELEEELVEKARLQEQITTLQKELENAADAGIELNKIVTDLLSNQTGDESIISSVEELQKQLNEQQNTILEINVCLADKSRENSELQLLIAEQNARYESEISNLQRDNDELEAEKGNLQSRLQEIKTDFDRDITAALEGKNFEIKRLQNEIVDLTTKVDAEHTKWQTSMAKVEALEECLKSVKRNPNVNITQVIDVANTRAELLDAQKKYTSLKERLELELDARKLSENQLHLITAEVEKLKQDFNQSEKDKLEAQTRLEVLSNYFKDKENQLQKELSLKETMWLKQQGETTTTVDRLTTMQEEIQSLKSQNDSLRAEIEAQVAAHKAQTGTLENRAHETWLAARQSDRRYEEARAEATALRRKLTALAGGNINEAIKPSAGPAGLGDDLTNAPSPIHMESPGSPMLGRMPPPPFLPPPFMGPPPPFMGMPPPPPFVPSGEMRPAPLGRIMSPPPPQRSGHLDYEDYLDYEGNNSWHRHHTYSPPPRTYRSLSPTDSRYNYGTERDLISTYDTETDFSPPPSPRESRRRGGGGGGSGGYGSDKDGGGNHSRNPYNNSKKSSAGNKGNISSGSDKSYNSSPKHGNKSKSSGGGGGKSLV